MDKKELKYQELAEWIQKQIRDGKLSAGQKLYSENKLKEMFGISRQTIRHAISLLEKDGIIRRVQGSGTYINDDRLANLARRKRISVITTNVDGYIFPRTIRGMEDVLIEQGYSIQNAFTNNQNSREKLLLEDIIEKDEVAGIIMETTKSGIPNPNLSLYHEIRRKKIPILFINSYYPQLKIPHVSISDHMAGWKMTKYLISMGHRNIGGIFKLDDRQGQMRYAGYVDALNEADIAVDDTRILWMDTEDVKHMNNAGARILERIKGCSALICYNDEVAFGLIEILKTEGIRVPEDISIVSVDNSELAILGEVKLTSVPHPMETLGRKAAENLLCMIKDPKFDGNYEFEVNLILRDSVKRIFAGKVV